MKAKFFDFGTYYVNSELFLSLTTLANKQNAWKRLVIESIIKLQTLYIQKLLAWHWEVTIAVHINSYMQCPKKLPDDTSCYEFPRNLSCRSGMHSMND